MAELNYSNVIFDSVAHTYTTPDGAQLSGVTSILSRQLFAEKYKNIPTFVLNRAAERGSAVHSAIELYNSFGDMGDLEEVQSYIRLCDKHCLNPIEGEYLISDNKHVASSIDVVFEDYSLADIKTTSHLDLDYISWQLSVYAWLFEMQNPHLKAGKLYAIWLPKPTYGAPKVVEVERIPSEECEKLILADMNGEQYAPASADKKTSLPTLDNIPEDLRSLAALMADAKREFEIAKSRVDEISEKLYTCMKNNNAQKYSDLNISASIKAAGTRTSVDTEKLKTDYPKVWEAVQKTSAVKESLTVKII